jgi:mono/diheme cytochrome c family protein
VRDLFAYLKHLHNSDQADDPDVEGDPDRGWTLYQQKGCIQCHSLEFQSDGIGRNLGEGGQLPATFSEFGEVMVNHFPEMQKAMRAKHSVPPRFENHDLVDIAVFLYGLHNPEPVGSAQIGKSAFTWRGCSRCHGESAEGTAKAPPLRGRGQSYTAALLATDLWRHGQRMYLDNRNHGQAWPELKPSDIGHLLTFLNTSPQP